MNFQEGSYYWVRRRSYTPWVVARAISENEVSFGMVSGYDEDYEDTAFVKDIYAIAPEPLHPPTGVHANPQYKWADEPWQGPSLKPEELTRAQQFIVTLATEPLAAYRDYMPLPALQDIDMPPMKFKWYRPANLEEPKP